MTHTLPETCKGLVLRDYSKGPSVETISTPQPGPGSVVVKVLAVPFVSQMAELLSGSHPTFKMAIPLVVGYAGVARVAAVGSDATKLQMGQLVLVEPFFRGRDDSTVMALWTLKGATTPVKKLTEDSWRDGMCAEYSRVPLENCYPLDENRLLGSPSEGGLGYDVSDLTYMVKQMVAYGGWRDINLQAGETVIIAPATGGFSGAAVEVAAAMGAQVIAAGRNMDTLKRLADTIPRVKIVQLTGDVERDGQALQSTEYGQADVFMEYSPPAITNPTHVKSAFMALKPYGRISLMGGLLVDIPINYWSSMIKSITIKAKFMYERSDVRGLIKLAEAGLLKLGPSGGIETVIKSKVEDWEKVVKAAQENSGWAKNSVVVF